MESSIYNKILEESKKNKKLLSFYQYSDTKSFYCGYVLSFNSEVIQIQHFTKFGINDGTLNLKYETIEHITINDLYIEGIQYLIDNPSVLNKRLEIPLPLRTTSEWVYETLSEYLNDESVCISVEINKDECYSGFIHEIDENYFILKEIYTDGTINGIYIFKIEDVTAIRINDLVSRKCHALYNSRKNK